MVLRIFELFSLWGLFIHLESLVNMVPLVFCGFELLILCWGCCHDVNLRWSQEHQRGEENDYQWLIVSQSFRSSGRVPFPWRSLGAHIVRSSLTTCKLRNRFQNQFWLKWEFEPAAEKQPSCYKLFMAWAQGFRIEAVSLFFFLSHFRYWFDYKKKAINFGIETNFLKGGSVPTVTLR